MQVHMHIFLLFSIFYVILFSLGNVFKILMDTAILFSIGVSEIHSQVLPATKK